MRTLEQRLSYEKLELIPSPSRKERTGLKQLQTLAAWIKTQLTQMLMGQDEPQIWTRPNNQGDVVWYVRDTHARQVESFASEEAVRVWLEERHQF